MVNSIDKQFQKNFKCREKFKKQFSKVIVKETDYYVDESPYDDYAIWLVRNGKDNLSDNLAVTAQINEQVTGLSELNFCLADIVNDGPAAYTDSRKDLKELIKLLKVIKRYLPKQLILKKGSRSDYSDDFLF